MASAVRVIVHSGKHGLEEAADYYKEFPNEPSPAGDLDLNGVVISRIEHATLELVLTDMGKASPGGIVLLVCHASDEGLFMPVAAGSRLRTSGKAAIARLVDVSGAERRARQIRAMPASTDAEKKAKIDAWVKLTDDMAFGMIGREVSLAQVEKLYHDGLDELSAHELFLVGPSPRATLLRLVALMEKVQALHLDRVELRACNIGASTTSMQKTKQLFGCNRLLAPIVGTFYLKDVPVKTMEFFGILYIGEHPSGRSRPPGPVGGTSNNPIDFLLDTIKKNPASRIFWDYQFGYIPPANPHPAPNRYDGGTSTIKMRRVVAAVVEKTGENQFRGSLGTFNQAGRHRPQWDDARTFVKDYIFDQAKYKKGALYMAGFWTPGEQFRGYCRTILSTCSILRRYREGEDNHCKTRGVLRDYVEADMWYELAASSVSLAPRARWPGRAVRSRSSPPNASSNTISTGRCRANASNWINSAFRIASRFRGGSRGWGSSLSASLSHRPSSCQIPPLSKWRCEKRYSSAPPWDNRRVNSTSPDIHPASFRVATDASSDS